MRNGHSGRRNSVRRTGAIATLVACVLIHDGNVAAAASEQSTVFLTLPTTKGFADATHALVETQELVRQSLEGMGELRLVDNSREADIVLTVLGRGRGDVELTAALRTLDGTIVAPPVPIGERERYIEVMLTIGSCNNTPDSAAERHAPDSCYRRIFVGVEFTDLDARRRTKKPALNSWEACADAVARDVRAWLATNASQLRTLRESSRRDE